MSTTPLRRPGITLGIGPQVVVVLLLVGLAAAMAVQPTRQLLAQRNRIEQMSNELHRFERTNRRLETYITRLNDPDYLEQEARAQLGLVRPGETTYIVMPPQAQKRHKRSRGAHRVSREQAGFLERVLEFIGLP